LQTVKWSRKGKTNLPRAQEKPAAKGGSAPAGLQCCPGCWSQRWSRMLPGWHPPGGKDLGTGFFLLFAACAAGETAKDHPEQ